MKATVAQIKTVREAQGAAGRRLDDRLVNAKTAPRRAVTAEHLAIHSLWLRDPGAADIQGIDTKRFDAPVKVDKKTLAWALNADANDPLPTKDPSGRVLSMAEQNAIAKLRGKKPEQPKKRDLVSIVRELETVTNKRDQLSDLLHERGSDQRIHRPAGYIGVTDEEFLNLIRSKYGTTRPQGDTLAHEGIDPYGNPDWFENMELEPEEKEALRSGKYKTLEGVNLRQGQTITSMRNERKELNLDIKDLEREIGRHFKGGYKEFRRHVAKIETDDRQRKPEGGPTVQGQATLEGGVIPAATEQDIIDRRAKQSGFNLTATGQDAPLPEAAEKSRPATTHALQGVDKPVRTKRSKRGLYL